MAIRERALQGEVSYWSEQVSEQGAHATRVWVVEASDLQRARPRIGEEYYPKSGLYCSEYRIEGMGRPTGYDSNGRPTFTHYQITCEYSSFQKIDTAPVITFDVSGEVVETGLGRKWKWAGTTCDQAQGVIYPQMEITINLVMAAMPQSIIIDRVGKVNYIPWQGYPAETLLYLGASTEARWDYQRRTYIYRVAHKFLFRPRGHNVIWRAPRQARDDSGALKWKDPETQCEPVFVTGRAGQGGWDRPIPPLYEYADFNPLIGLPPAIPVRICENASLEGASDAYLAGK